MESVSEMIGEIVQSKVELGLLRASIIMVESPSRVNLVRWREMSNWAARRAAKASPVSREQELRALTNCFQQGLE